jgi:hypothetical protein
MNAYELILNLDPLTLTVLLSKGYLRSSVQRDVEIYKYYLNEKKIYGCMQARTNTSERFHLGEDMISKIIQRMK